MAHDAEIHSTLHKQLREKVSVEHINYERLLDCRKPS